MFKRLVSLILIFIFLFSPFLVITASAQFDIGAQLPGFNCGVAGQANGVDKCCIQSVPDVATLPDDWYGVASRIPLLGYAFNAWQDKAQRINAAKKALVSNPCIYGDPKPNATDPSCVCTSTVIATPSAVMIEMCYKYLTKSTPAGLADCLRCAGKGDIGTALGCVPMNVKDFIGSFLLSWGIGLAGGFALLCIIYSAFIMQTSMGNPERVKKAQENLTSCIVGLILIIFSVFILKLIGVSILRIPGLS